jgi:protease-4
MSLDPDILIDRRALKRRVSFWRVLAIVAAVVAVIAALGAGGAFKAFVPATQAQIARISISGFISPDRKLLDLIERVGKADEIKGVVIDIDSGGGASVGGEAIYEAVHKLAGKKPTTAFIGSIGASAAYMIALGADHIVARKTALTASIGVLAEWPDATKLLDTVGVKFDSVRSSPIKGKPDGVTPTPQEAKDMLNLAILDTYKYFVDLVSDRRHMPMDQVKVLADGRVVTGVQAKDLKLIDDVGEESVAIDWLEKERGVAANLPVRDWKPKKDEFDLFSMSSLAEGITRGILSATGLDETIRSWRTLDGLQSVWHPVVNDNTKTSEGIGK